MLKKPSNLLFSYSRSYSLYNSQTPIPYASNSTADQPLFQGRVTRRHQRQRYATVRDELSDHHQIKWPESKSATVLPTPYQIFQQKQSAPYSKRRFYELVKIYHPDRHCHGEEGSEHASLSQAIKIERYRLVVAANEILSDPARRKAYDECGAGWNGRPDAASRKYGWSSDANGPWSGFHDNSSAARNATWEDWETWYQRNQKGEKVPQEPVYFSNEGFLSLLAILACLGGIGQATRIGDQKKSYLKQMETIHSDCSQDTQRRMELAQGYGNKDERVQSFLATREQSGLLELNEEHYRRSLPPPDESS